MLHRAFRPGYLTEDVNSTMTAVHIWVTAWLILCRLQGLAKNTVVSGQKFRYEHKKLTSVPGILIDCWVRGDVWYFDFYVNMAFIVLILGIAGVRV